MQSSNHRHGTVEKTDSSIAPAEAPYISFIRKALGYGPKGFIRSLDRYAPVKIAHNIAFNVYRFESFEHLWSREWLPEEPELELAVRWLRKDLSDRSRSRVEAVIGVWWHIHDIQPCEVTLYMSVEEAWVLTEAHREQYRRQKEENRPYKTPNFVRDYLQEHTTASAAEIKRQTGIDRKQLNQALGRLCKKGEVKLVSRGVYRLNGDR